MPRYYVRRSFLGMFVRLWLGFGALFVLLMGVEWFLTDLLPAVAPFLLVAALVSAVFWLVSRGRR